ncbi:MAG: transglycosylase domain-containing protein [Myxococcales bacterium]|nr:transglycosylase domain-containing protein [Myxococcales bacterium]
MSASHRAETPKPKATLPSLAKQHWKPGALALLVLAALAAYPAVGGIIATRVLAAKVKARLDLPLSVARARAGVTALTFQGLTLGTAPGPTITVAKVVVPLGALWGQGTIEIEAPELKARSLAELRALSRKRSAPVEALGPTASRDTKLTALTVHRGRIHIGRDDWTRFAAERIEAEIIAGAQARVELANVAGDLSGLVPGLGRGAGGFGAEALELRVALAGLRPKGMPSVSIEDGYLQALPTLGLSGISGEVKPVRSGAREVSLAFHGSYGGSRERLWNAVGHVVVGPSLESSSGQLALRAERFTLDKIEDILPPSVRAPARTSVDGALKLALDQGAVAVEGRLDIAHLDIFHPALAPDPVEDLSLALKLETRLDTKTRTLDLQLVEGQLADLVGRLAGRIELAPGQVSFPDGHSWPWVPKLSFTLDVPKIPCGKLLGSFPKALVPRLQGFSLQGSFEAHLSTHVDYADLETVALDGSVGIGGCRVAEVPPEVADLTDPDMPITQVVTVPPAWDEKGDEPQELMFVVGADSGDFVPYQEVSPHLVSAFLTTEDASFFKHQGFATREFRTALKRNLANGRFRQGASSITMQMVKNLLLSQEKTLSRKLQELFLVWHLEQVLSKERILELYLNAIEFGPRLFGIGPAARHYFGKSAAELTPLEAAYFSSILPSPKRRYVHYCRGALSASADRHVRRILHRMHERGRISNEELEAFAVAPLVFDTSARAMTERQCLDWVTRITADPKRGAEALDDLDAAE